MAISVPRSQASAHQSSRPVAAVGDRVRGREGEPDRAAAAKQLARRPGRGARARARAASRRERAPRPSRERGRRRSCSGWSAAELSRRPWRDDPTTFGRTIRPQLGGKTERGAKHAAVSKTATKSRPARLALARAQARPRRNGRPARPNGKTLSDLHHGALRRVLALAEGRRPLHRRPPRRGRLPDRRGARAPREHLVVDGRALLPGARLRGLPRASAGGDRGVPQPRAPRRTAARAASSSTSTTPSSRPRSPPTTRTSRRRRATSPASRSRRASRRWRRRSA